MLQEGKQHGWLKAGGGALLFSIGFGVAALLIRTAGGVAAVLKRTQKIRIDAELKAPVKEK
jgi:hypothetical protein